MKENIIVIITIGNPMFTKFVIKNKYILIKAAPMVTVSNMLFIN